MHKVWGFQCAKHGLLYCLPPVCSRGASTAFAGPIGFVGLAVPHLVRLLLPTSEHRILLPAVFIMGGCLLLLCDTLAQLPGLEYSLPINGVTSMVGAPLLIWLILRKRKIEL